MEEPGSTPLLPWELEILAWKLANLQLPWKLVDVSMEVNLLPGKQIYFSGNGEVDLLPWNSFDGNFHGRWFKQIYFH